MKKIKNIFKNKVTRNAGWMIIGRIYQMSLSFVVSMLTARYLGPSNYGLINYASSFTSFFSTFCVLGINSVIVKNFIDHPNEEGRTTGSAIVVMNYFLIPLFGASGAAFASVVTQISTIMIFPLFIRKMRPNVKLMLDAICLKDVF